MESCCCNALRTNFSCYRLNDICDALSNQRDALKTIRGATPPSRNGLSNANKIRDAAKTHDAGHVREVCAGIKAGEIVVFDKAYVDFSHLFDLDCFTGLYINSFLGTRK